MTPFLRLEGVAAPMPIDNVDTDAIIPSRETQSVVRTGYGEKLFANWRYRPGTREPDPAFVLNQPPFDQARILVAARNFGCGSSREAAVWALQQFGIACVIAESFGAIFRNNCVRNGLLPVSLSLPEVQRLLDELQKAGGARRMDVDLEACRVRAPGGAEFAFRIGALEREMLLKGADEIALTLSRRAQIEAFRDRDRRARPWVYATA
ncbi:MAG: 3-isopropylmalate dehydratase small subunit [Caulobacteraceae bacterium]|nr:3-isopropylmalate dehydratase small subunit [Caulobacteraceae bacterium]